MKEASPNSGNLGPFPIAESLLAAFDQMHPSEEEKVAAREVLETAFDQETRHIERYRNDASTAAFPWTHLKLSELRDALLHREPKELPMNKLIFSMASARGVKAGHPFIFAEEGLRAVLRKLPAAIKDEEEGDVQSYTLGGPTNYWGAMSEEFADEMEDDAFGSLGKLYAEFIRKEIQKHSETKIVELIGVSMGGHMAMRAAQVLLEEGLVRRLDGVHAEESTDEDGVPTLRLKIMSPAHIDKKFLSSIQLQAGFVADGVYGILTQPWLWNIVKHEKTFFPRIQEHLGLEGFNDNTAPDIPLKRRGVKAIMKHLLSGKTEIPEGVKPDIIRGTVDASSYSPAFNRKAAAQAKKYEGSLAQPLVADSQNRREWALNYGHMPPYGSEHEMRRLQFIARSLMEVRKGKQE